MMEILLHKRVLVSYSSTLNSVSQETAEKSHSKWPHSNRSCNLMCKKENTIKYFKKLTCDGKPSVY